MANGTHTSLIETARKARQVLLDVAAQQDVGVHHEREGHVERAADGILHVAGLDSIGYGDLVQIGNDRALVMDLNEHYAVAATLGDAESNASLCVGMRVRQSAERLGIPVSEHLLGRVIDPLGRASDGAGPITHSGRSMPLERKAPQIFERAPVRHPLYTGILAIDAMFPIGRGQRELIAGDEGTGKTSLAVDTMLNQTRSDVICVYAGVGQRRAETWRISEQLKRAGARFVLVSAPEDSSPALRYLAPYAATAIGEYFRDRGQHALCIYDDLSAHAVAWRELSLLLGRPPGREAYPGDVFFLHSRLLERSAQLSDARGGGSLTALPICSLESGRLTAYIPTNLVSITDGQLVMSAALFASGQRPSIDAGLSVSRVGARAQSQLLASHSSHLKLEYASFLELETFARLGTRLEPEARKRIDVGRRVRQLLKAQQGAPLSVLDELVRLSLAEQRDLILELEESDVLQIAQDVSRRLSQAHPSLESDAREGAISKTQLAEWVATETRRYLGG